MIEEDDEETTQSKEAITEEDDDNDEDSWTLDLRDGILTLGKEFLLEPYVTDYSSLCTKDIQEVKLSQEDISVESRKKFIRKTTYVREHRNHRMCWRKRYQISLKTE